MSERSDATAQATVELILRSDAFAAELAVIAADLKLSPQQATARARACLNEMVSVQKPWVLRLYQWVLRPMHARAWNVRVDTDGLAQLALLNQRQALVFLPSHRSYADPLVLGGVLRDGGFPANFTLPGANMAFWPLGPMLRRVGGITIRRSFRDDPIYKLALRCYFAHLTAHRTNLEWYIEGGRSRTGKLRPPRYGLLRYLVDAVADGRAPDVALVPVSISYDQLPEVRSMAAEEQGAPKAPEGLAWLVRYVRQQRHHVGAVHVRFGVPLPLSEGLAMGQAGAGNPRLAVERIAFEVCDRINQATPVMANALVTLVLLGMRGRAQTLEQVRLRLIPLLDYVALRRLPSDGLDALRDPVALARVLGALSAVGLVHRHAGGVETVYNIAAGQHNVAAFYRNAAIHWFVNRALVELAFLTIAQYGAGEPRQQAWEEALRLRDLLKFEFFFARKQVFAEQLTAELDLIDPAWQHHGSTTDGARQLLAGLGFVVALRVLRSFLESYLVAAEVLAGEDPALPLDEAAFVARCVGVARQYQLQGRLLDPASISREGFANALKLAANRGLLEPGAGQLLDKRRALAAQLQEILARVAAIDAIEAQRAGESHVPL